jgi:two-component sensor histidine kinase
MQRLLRENARLKDVCVQSQAMAAQYELLLREGGHRIKNSLQVVVSLLGLQARREETAVARAALRAAAARVQAVARIHDALQLNGGDDLVDVGALIETMCKSLRDMADDCRSVSIIADVQPVHAPIALAQPLVLAVNELVINALRHAFPDQRGGSVVVTVARCDHLVRIAVADDGAGLPADFAQARGYGMTLVRAMIAKAGGRLDVHSAAGARFTLSAPLTGLALAPSGVVADSREAALSEAR